MGGSCSRVHRGISTIGNTVSVKLLPYTRQKVAVREYDAAWPRVAQFVADVIRSNAPHALIDHVGSTAVPGLAGKGIVDLMVVAPPSQIPGLTQRLVAVGLQRRQTGFPATRPLLFAGVQDGEVAHQVHVHIVPEGDDEVIVQRELVTALRDDPVLREEYANLKRRIVAAGTTDPVPYSMGKDAWLATTLQRLGLPPTPVAFQGPPPDRH